MPFQPPIVEDLSNPELSERLKYKLDNKTKPQGSLGRIEELAQRI